GNGYFLLFKHPRTRLCTTPTNPDASKGCRNGELISCIRRQPIIDLTRNQALLATVEIPSYQSRWVLVYWILYTPHYCSTTLPSLWRMRCCLTITRVVSLGRGKNVGL
ncbi:hypothetical protein L9F63_005679, partial [Diploptera punctata]